MCGCECCISDKIIHSSLLSWHKRYLEKPKYKSCNAQNIISGEMYNCVLDKYRNYFMPHFKNMSQTESDMAMA